MNKVAYQGFSSSARDYAFGRPDYPAELISWLRNSLELDLGKTVLDLGAGTGKFTKLLVRTGAKVMAVEPIPQMRDQFALILPQIEILSGTAEEIPLDSSSQNAVVCAQAFHWFSTEDALREIHRVLAPGGKLGLIWNVRDESVDWVAEITKIISPYEGDAPRFHNHGWKASFDNSFFGTLHQSIFDYHHLGAPEQVIVDRFLSVSFIACLSSKEKAKFVDQLRDLIQNHPDLKGKDSIAFPYKTEAFFCVKK